MDFKNFPNNYDHIVSKISKQISFKDMKNLSLVSKGWLLATTSFFEQHYFNLVINKAEELASFRTVRVTYKNFKITVDYSSINPILELLVQWIARLRAAMETERRKFMIEEIYLKQVTLNDKSFTLLNQLKRLNSLRIEECNFKKINTVLNLNITKVVIQFYCNDLKPEIFDKIISKTVRSLTFNVRDVTQYSGTLTNGELLSNLEVLISRNSCIDDNILEEICQNNKFLRKITHSKYFKIPQAEVLTHHCPNLEYIKFSDYNGINRKVMDTLESLKEIGLKIHKEETVNWMSETGLPQVTSLQLYHGIYNFFDDCKMMKMFSNLKNITDLYIDFGSLKSPTIFSILSKTLQNLKFLQFYGFSIYDDEVIPEEALDIQPFQSLEELNLVASKVPESLLCRIQAPILKDFSIFGKITNKALLHFAAESPLIESIYASIALNVNDESIRKIVHSLKNLKKFTLNSKDMTTHCVGILLEDSINGF